MASAAAETEPPRISMAFDLCISGLNHGSTNKATPVVGCLGSITTMVEQSAWDRLRAVWDPKVEMSITNVAKALGMTYQAARKIKLGGGISFDSAKHYAQKRGLSPEWLMTGSGKREVEGSTSEAREGDMHHEPSNTQPVTTKGRVPLISWVIAGNLEEVQDMYQPGEADEWVETTEAKPGKGSFALRVTGDSMVSPYPGDVSFPDGTVIIVDPTRACDAGDFVIAKDVTTQKATFKRLVHDGGQWFLKPLNPAYPIMPIDDPALRTIGRVIESHTRRKL